MSTPDSTVERRRGLGRGLGALIPAAPMQRRSGPHDLYFSPVGGSSAGTDATPGEAQADAVADDATTVEAQEPTLSEVAGLSLIDLPLDRVRTNPRQPREVFDEDELAELAFSLREVGVLQPVVVRPNPDEPGGYELVVGERRWRAAQIAGLASVPALVRETSDTQMLRDALLENLHRAQLNPLEEAAAYTQLLDEFGCTQDELAGRIGRSRPQISNTMRLLRLPPTVQRRVASGILSAGHARALLSLADPLEVETLAQRIVAEGLSVRTVEEIVAGSSTTSPRRRPRVPREVPERVNDGAARLADRLDTRVTVAMSRAKGRLTIEFASTDDFDRIMAALGEHRD